MAFHEVVNNLLILFLDFILFHSTDIAFILGVEFNCISSFSGLCKGIQKNASNYIEKQHYEEDLINSIKYDNCCVR